MFARLVVTGAFLGVALWVMLVLVYRDEEEPSSPVLVDGDQNVANASVAEKEVGFRLVKPEQRQSKAEDRFRRERCTEKFVAAALKKLESGNIQELACSQEAAHWETTYADLTAGEAAALKRLIPEVLPFTWDGGDAVRAVREMKNALLSRYYPDFRFIRVDVYNKMSGIAGPTIICSTLAIDRNNKEIFRVVAEDFLTSRPRIGASKCRSAELVALFAELEQSIFVSAGADCPQNWIQQEDRFAGVSFTPAKEARLPNGERVYLFEMQKRNNRAVAAKVVLENGDGALKSVERLICGPVYECAWQASRSGLNGQRQRV